MYLSDTCSQFPTATVTNYHRLQGLKQYNLFITMLEVRSLKSKVCRDAFLLEGSGGNPLPWFLSAFGGGLHSLALVPFPLPL